MLSQEDHQQGRRIGDPWKRNLFRAIVKAAVDNATPAGIPVTVKMRKGIDDNHLTYLEAGKIAQDVGVTWVALHARTAGQRYSGEADWDAIAQLKSALDIPVLGNGDIWEAEDAIRMVTDTSCDGVVVGRGCLGRPWLFADLANVFAHRPERATPRLGEVAAVMRRHAQLLTDWWGQSVRQSPTSANTLPGTSIEANLALARRIDEDDSDSRRLREHRSSITHSPIAGMNADG